MNEISGLTQDEKLFTTNISTCIPRCEKRIYGTIRMNAEMGEKIELFINRNKSMLNFNICKQFNGGMK